jgi:hypothetical protein
LKTKSNKFLSLQAMKKVLFTFLAVLYLGSSSSFAMHFHYCMDQLIGASLVEEELDACSNCGMEVNSTDDNGCCKEEFKPLKGDDSQNVEDFALQVMKTLGTSLPPATFDIPSFLRLATSAADYPLVNSPPENTAVPVYLRNCVFRI